MSDQRVEAVAKLFGFVDRDDTVDAVWGNEYALEQAREILRAADAETAKQITAISAWIDHSRGYAGLDPEAHNWRRIQKMVQEAGEVFEAYCGTLGENPRKGVTHTMADVERELYDVALSALGAAEHLNRNDGETFGRFLEHVKGVCDRALESMDKERQ